MTDTLKVILADDELIARKRLRRLLEAMANVTLLAECTDGSEVPATVAEHPDVDVLLLDINMPELTGLETKALLGDDGPYVVFTTAHREHALEAFDVGAVDYVLKPIEAGRLKQALDRARAHLTSGAGDLGDGRNSGDDEAARGTNDDDGASLSRVALPTRDGARLLDPSRITHAVFDGSLVTVHYGDEALLTELTLTDLEAKLPAGAFTRVHRRALINLEQIDRLVDQPTGGYVAITRGGAQVEVSRKAARELRRRLGLR